MWKVFVELSYETWKLYRKQPATSAVRNSFIELFWKISRNAPVADSSSIMVSRGVNSLPWLLVPPLWLTPPYDDFKTSHSPPLCSSEPYKYNNYDKAAYIVSSYPLSPLTNLFARWFTCPQAKRTPNVSIDTPTNTF